MGWSDGMKGLGRRWRQKCLWQNRAKESKREGYGQKNETTGLWDWVVAFIFLASDSVGWRRMRSVRSESTGLQDYVTTLPRDHERPGNSQSQIANSRETSVAKR